MEEEKYQKELFEYEPQKKSFSRLTDMLPKADFEGKVTLTISLEKMVFISIGVIMAMVIVYALGVESGRSTLKSPQAQMPKPVRTVIIPMSPQNRISVMPDKNILNTAPVASLSKPAAPVKQLNQNQPKPVAAAQSPMPFTIIACTLTKLENAQAAGSLLAKRGFTVSVSYSAPYYRVCIGAYANKNSPEAQRDLLKVRRIYKDAFIKLK